MGKVDDEFVHDRVRANRAANRRQTKVGRIDWYEMEGVETLQLFVSHPTRHGRDVIDIWLRDHGSHRGIHISRLELVAAMILPKRDQIRLCHTMLPFRLVHSEA